MTGLTLFVLVSGKSDWFNEFCDLFIYEKNSSTQFFLLQFTWWAETDKHLWGANLLFSSMICFSFSKRLILVFCVVYSATGMPFLYRFLGLMIPSKLFLHLGISGQIFLASIFEVLDYHFHPASCSQKDRIELHLVQVHHCLVCSFGCRFLF